MKPTYPDNHINLDAERLGELDTETVANFPHAPGWLPMAVYNLVQSGEEEREPDHGEMVRATPHGCNEDGQVLPPDGMWCKAADVRALLDDIEIERQREREILNALAWEAERLGTPMQHPSLWKAIVAAQEILRGKNNDSTRKIPAKSNFFTKAMAIAKTPMLTSRKTR